jgi:hypothetical protein
MGMAAGGDERHLNLGCTLFMTSRAEEADNRALARWVR